jgi:hypothetical protein
MTGVQRHRASQAANAEALEKIISVEPSLVDVAPASNLAPELGPYDVLHAGPPLSGWNEACGALRGAVIGRAFCEGWAKDLRGAEELARDGRIRLKSANDHGVLGTFGGSSAGTRHYS